MKYFIAESVMNERLPVTPEELERDYLPLHVAHMQQGVAAGLLLMAGPNETGGFLILRGESREAVEASSMMTHRQNASASPQENIVRRGLMR